ncbi:MAG: peptide ABC transporter substrate-binding protein [Acidobacteria bacterium]|jgi:oligopeptide transport system substrate-binding protein|nr:peptide ABC transporter substrate-binding protein [Acidobacteriota bacterium]MBA4124281.1 peptide ABC transporter substrate-binding protein [Acidobacteriota bacterium]
MTRISLKQTCLGIASVAVSLFLVSCTSSANNRFWGRTVAPTDNVLRYISGSEPESLDPAFGTGQPEARVYMALYEGLLEYHPKTMEPIPAIAESWEINEDGTEYLFHLRKNAKFSNGDPITAKDFVYTFRRSLSPELASRNANLGYYIKYAEAYNSGSRFVRDTNGQFLLKKDLVKEGGSETVESNHETQGVVTEFHKFIDSPERLTVKADEKERAKQLEADPKLKAAVEGKELVPVRDEDIGVEAVDDYTLRIKLYQPAPYFIQLLPHQLFRVVHQPSIENFGKNWMRVGNIVTSGAFKLSVHRPYDELVVVKDPNYWDAANVKLDAIEFYPLEESTTMMNLYKGGRADAVYNHIVPPAWLDEIRPFKAEYMDHPEAANEYYSLSVKKPPMDNLKVRQALSLAINREALAQFRKTPKPLSNFTPDGIFPKYDEARKKVFGEKLKAENITVEEWSKQRLFDPEKARKLMTEAGFPVQKAGNGWSCPTFPVDKVTLNYNTAESNKAIAEFNQAQWKQNLGITIPIKNMEWKTFLPFRAGVQYQGMARNAWSADYMDPFTFLNLFYSPQNDGATGFWDPKYDALLDSANKELDSQKRLEMLATAEFQVLQEQLVIPLVTQATNWMKKPYVKGLYPNPGTLHAWKFVYIERDPNKWDVNAENIMKDEDPKVEEQINRVKATMIAQR